MRGAAPKPFGRSFVKTQAFVPPISWGLRFYLQRTIITMSALEMKQRLVDIAERMPDARVRPAAKLACHLFFDDGRVGFDYQVQIRVEMPKGDDDRERASRAIHRFNRSL